jgi:flagellar motor protein MotB
MTSPVTRQGSSYRQGLVLGFTLAEIMILLIFCLLIAMAAFLQSAEGKRAEIERQLETEKTGRIDAESRLEVALNKPLPGESKATTLMEKKTHERLQELAGPSGITEMFWRELVVGRDVVAELRKAGIQPAQIRLRIAEQAALSSAGITSAKALADADLVKGIQDAFRQAGEPEVSTKRILEVVAHGLKGDATGKGHQWPPIISLREADGYYFKTGSAELSPDFKEKLVSVDTKRIAKLAERYGVDIIEVVGHTDEQPIVSRPSNLDRSLLPVLKNTANILSLAPADNAGLGLARAVSVLTVLLQSKELSAYKLLPLSGAQLVNVDETLATAGMPGDIQERRRIEIRLRKSTPHEGLVTTSIPTPPSKPRSVPKPLPRTAPQVDIQAPVPPQANIQPLRLFD